MSPKADQLLTEVLRLPETERLALADQILDSVEGEQHEDLSPEWRAEVAERLRSIKDGTAVLDEWNDVERELLELTGR